jgi:putative ABC transport system permease protein
LTAARNETASARLPDVWVSEAMTDLYGIKLGATVHLPVGGRDVSFNVAGVWRDYARSTGAVVISRSDYLRFTGDDSANEASLWLAAGADLRLIEPAIRTILGASHPLDIMSNADLHARSLRIFDRAFAVTYALELLAIVIGLAGISVAASSTALARRAEFGMLRHIGMTRRQITHMLACEGLITSSLGVAYGLGIGLILSLVLVFVIDRQSFHWSIDFAVPAAQLIVLATVLIAAAALTSIWSGRAATQRSALDAVREDW